ncbi:hypothetical protein DERP_007561 [Dermatophagoides pteronyssinus]|uniref:Uncharacterized protein n=1 Tax=Dermatophagoides pteronyssinus TaxID=6956 RepID=A0ABQ8JKP0_DERPT|nr:hypothetical protein DERP_007561 [Dermatophagoides pteronyssinus]
MKKITIIVNYNHIGRIRIMDHHGLYLFIDRIFFVMLCAKGNNNSKTNSQQHYQYEVNEKKDLDEISFI